jgi:hypothetical protein
MKTTAKERQRWRRTNLADDAGALSANDEIRLLDDVDDLLGSLAARDYDIALLRKENKRIQCALDLSQLLIADWERAAVDRLCVKAGVVHAAPVPPHVACDKCKRETEHPVHCPTCGNYCGRCAEEWQCPRCGACCRKGAMPVAGGVTGHNS